MKDKANNLSFGICQDCIHKEKLVSEIIGIDK